MIRLLDRVLKKILLEYRKIVFRKKIDYKGKDFSILGPIYLSNKNIHLGHNVTFYPNVMIFGDGDVYIGDDVDIGTSTIIYASYGGGYRLGETLKLLHNAI